MPVPTSTGCGLSDPFSLLCIFPSLNRRHAGQLRGGDIEKMDYHSVFAANMAVVFWYSFLLIVGHAKLRVKLQLQRYEL